MLTALTAVHQFHGVTFACAANRVVICMTHDFDLPNDVFSTFSAVSLAKQMTHGLPVSCFPPQLILPLGNSPDGAHKNLARDRSLDKI